MKLRESKGKKITKDKNHEHNLKIEITEVQWLIVNNTYQYNSKVLYTFVPNKSFGSINR